MFSRKSKGETFSKRYFFGFLCQEHYGLLHFCFLSTKDLSSYQTKLHLIHADCKNGNVEIMRILVVKEPRIMWNQFKWLARMAMSKLLDSWLGWKAKQQCKQPHFSSEVQILILQYQESFSKLKLKLFTKNKPNLRLFHSEV